MNVFHLLNLEYGLSDICHQRIKVATLDELNDPFEFFGIDLREARLRRVVTKVKEREAKTTGLLCFTRNWHEPLLWSHYAARHTGICLGFDVPEDLLHMVTYQRRRVAIGFEQIRAHSITPSTLVNSVFTKYWHWRYESEARMLVKLQHAISEDGLFFAPFGDKLRLTTVIAGTLASVTRRELHDALGNLATSVAVFKARLAFGTFRIVRQRREELWV
jgi:hypothetical protein